MRQLRPGLFLLLMVLVALNLRPALAAMAPLLGQIQRDLELSATTLGALTTLPVLALGLFAPLAPRLARTHGLERTLSLALLILVIGQLIRAWPSTVPLFIGTLLCGAAISLAGTLLPVLVKRALHQRADLATGLYTMALCLGGAICAGLSVPLSSWLGGWAPSLGSWALLALVALIVWWLVMPQPRPAATPATATDAPPQPHVAGLRRNALAWHITLVMGCQSALAYTVFGWLPTLLQARGISEIEAGYMLSGTVLCQTVAALCAPWLARLGRDQRPALVLLQLLTAAGMLLALLGDDDQVWTGMVMLGLGQGGNFSLALTLIVLRSATPTVAAALSGMVQGIGYCIAAFGPLIVGLLLEWQLGLNAIATTLATLIALAIFFSLLAGRQLQLVEDAESGQVVTRARH